MDTLRAISADDDAEAGYPAADEPCMDPPPAIGGDERRMHVRAYNHWVSLLRGPAFPSIDDLDPASLKDFGPNSVLLDFRDDPENPAISFLGAALRAEGQLDDDIRRIAEVPERSLVSRLTGHFLEIIAHRAPLGFEAEFINQRGTETMYRGILMPFSSDGETIDFIYGVINWKERAAPTLVADIAAAIGRSAPVARAPLAHGVSAWADGPSHSGFAFAAAETGGAADPRLPAANGEAPVDPLADPLALARQSADSMRTCDVRSRAALYRALSTAYDLALAAEASPAAFRALLADTGLRIQGRSGMTAIARLVFGDDCDKARLAEYAAVLTHARRRGLRPGAMRNFLENQEGGLKAVVAAEREARRDDAPPERALDTRDALRRAKALARLTLDAGDNEFVLLVARRTPAGKLAVVGAPVDSALLDRAIRKLS